MNDGAGEVRRKVDLARKAFAARDYKKARTLLKGIQHPKAADLLAQIDAAAATRMPSGTSKAQSWSLRWFGLIGGLVLIIVVGGWFAFKVASSQAALPAQEFILPTLVPTADCTAERVVVWWQTQNLVVDDFVTEASAASRTMPGTQLTGALESLRQRRMEFAAVPVPLCAALEVQSGAADLLSAMDDIIAILEQWSAGSIDGTTLTNTLAAPEEVLRQARAQIRRSL
jgi:hypothetical protein